MDHAPETPPLALPQSRPWGRVFVRRVGLGIAGFALLVLLDWQPSLGLLRGLLPGMVLKPLAALGFLLAGLVLANEARRVPWPAVSVLLSVAIAVAGAASLHADLAGVALASDRWFPDPEAAITSGIAGRMSPLTACGLLLLGLLGALRLDGACLRLRHGLALLVLGIAMFTLAAQTGLRLSEITGLRITSLHLGAGPPRRVHRQGTQETHHATDNGDDQALHPESLEGVAAAQAGHAPCAASLLRDAHARGDGRHPQGRTVARP